MTGTKNDEFPKRTPLIPPQPLEELSTVSTSSAEHMVCLILFRMTSTQRKVKACINVSCDSLFLLLQSGSSESIIIADMPSKVQRRDSIPELKKGTLELCEVPGGMLELSYYTRPLSIDPRCKSCIACGTHGVIISLKRGKLLGFLFV